jgi:hypothetical protein
LKILWKLRYFSNEYEIWGDVINVSGYPMCAGAGQLDAWKALGRKFLISGIFSTERNIPMWMPEIPYKNC